MSTLHPATDPAVYTPHAARFSQEGQPTTAQGWISRAQDVAAILAADATQRDAANASPVAEVSLLKSSGLLRVLGRASWGGGAQPWSVAYRAIREVAKGDGSIGMLLGYSLLWSQTASVVGTPAQAAYWGEKITRENLFIGGAVNPRDADLEVTEEEGGVVFSGSKHFNTGGVVSDLTVLEGVIAGTEKHVFAFVETRQEGIVFAHNWNNIGLRLTESGGVRINAVRAPWTDALGYDPHTKAPIPGILEVPYATLLLPTIQLVFANFYLGITQGALDAARAYTTRSTRPWPFGGDVKTAATDEFYILERYGAFFASVRAVETLADRAGAELSTLYAEHSEARDVSAERRGEVAEWVASAKVAATDVGLRVTSDVFEVTGAKATSRSAGLDRFWRDVRTHSLHDPVAYKRRELGRYFLLGELPVPTWYT
ncbi:thermophilic desulfurizing enzyme family protein [Trichodelitschia bisporula]|uniref:Thermophilic desulfurizing enzyme family protein n=1 Tax=Trichodelitschia bisporula TaxID=703511 RepID=A0A6G1HZ49_9PEZI|nr:thermophilic desulfurizing enzyme family protein [Trichodelitschia bisporula]